MIETEILSSDVFGQVKLGHALQVLHHLGAFVEKPSACMQKETVDRGSKDLLA